MKFVQFSHHSLHQWLMDRDCFLLTHWRLSSWFSSHVAESQIHLSSFLKQSQKSMILSKFWWVEHAFSVHFCSLDFLGCTAVSTFVVNSSSKFLFSFHCCKCDCCPWQNKTGCNCLEIRQNHFWFLLCTSFFEERVKRIPTIDLRVNHCANHPFPIMMREKESSKSSRDCKTCKLFPTSGRWDDDWLIHSIPSFLKRWWMLRYCSFCVHDILYLTVLPEYQHVTNEYIRGNT